MIMEKKTEFNMSKYNYWTRDLSEIRTKVAETLGAFMEWGTKEEVSKEWFEELLRLPEYEIHKHLNFERLVRDLQVEYLQFRGGNESNSRLECYADFLRELGEIVTALEYFITHLSEIRDCYGKYFTIEDDELVETADAKRLIMEQCIEWGEVEEWEEED